MPNVGETVLTTRFVAPSEYVYVVVLVMWSEAQAIAELTGSNDCCAPLLYVFNWLAPE